MRWFQSVEFEQLDERLWMCEVAEDPHWWFGKTLAQGRRERDPIAIAAVRVLGKIAHGHVYPACGIAPKDALQVRDGAGRRGRRGADVENQLDARRGNFDPP
jgi:hypothetical protein